MLGRLSTFSKGGSAGELSVNQIGRPRGLAADGGGGEDGPWNDVAAKAAIKAAHEKVNRLIKEARQAVDDVKLAIQMGNDRMNDRTMEEAKLKKVAQTEVEVTQAMALLPYSKEMYDYKVQQLNGVDPNDRRSLKTVARSKNF